MSVTVFNPKDIQVGPIGQMMAAKVENPDLKAFFASKDDADGNLSAIVVGDREALGVGVGTWAKGQGTAEPIPLAFDEVLFIVEGSLSITVDEQTTEVRQGQVAHLPAKQQVMFRSEEGCRLVWVTSPPTWKALEAAWKKRAMG